MSYQLLAVLPILLNRQVPSCYSGALPLLAAEQVT